MSLKMCRSYVSASFCNRQLCKICNRVSHHLRNCLGIKLKKDLIPKFNTINKSIKLNIKNINSTTSVKAVNLILKTPTTQQQQQQQIKLNIKNINSTTSIKALNKILKNINSTTSTKELN